MNRFSTDLNDCDSLTHRRVSGNRLVSLIAMAMLRFALASLQAQSSATNTVTPGSALTPEVMTKMLQLLALRGFENELNPKVVTDLGLTPPWPERYIGVNASPLKYLHSFAVSRGTDQDIVLALRTQDTIHGFRAHRDGKIVAAVDSDIRTGQVTIRAPNEAQKDLDVELAFWAERVDRLIAGDK